MLMVMQLNPEYINSLNGIRLRVGLFGLVTVLAIPTIGLPWPSRLPFKNCPTDRVAQAVNPALGETQTQANQAVAESPQGQTPAGSEQQSSGTEPPDETLAGIRAALQNVSSPDLDALGQAFDTRVMKPDAAPAEIPTVKLIELGDLDGDGVPEVVMKVPGVGERQSDVQSPASPSSWLGLYLLCWDGAHWKASSLAASGQHSEFRIVRLGKGVAQGIAVVNVIGEDRLPYPAVFQVREHEADLLWDSQVGDNRYNPLQHGRIEFLDDPKLDRTVMIETGHADPGLLEFEPGGRRGFEARCVYHWDGQAYAPGQTDYSPGPDNTLYRFIAALHLHDFRQRLRPDRPREIPENGYAEPRAVSQTDRNALAGILG